VHVQAIQTTSNEIIKIINNLLSNPCSFGINRTQLHTVKVAGVLVVLGLAATIIIINMLIYEKVGKSMDKNRR